jgi:hypothetical protein
MKSESYAPVSRGLRQHLAGMSGNAVKLYLELLLSAAFAGPSKGQVAVTFAELALTLSQHKQTIHKAARELRPYFIQWEPAKNQYGVTVFTIQRYKSIKDFAVSHSAHSEVTADVLPDEKTTQHVDSTVKKPPSTVRNLYTDNGLSGPNKLKKLKKEAAAAAQPKPEDLVWNFLEIKPCGPISFRTLLESRWASKNGDRPSVVIGEVVDAWETAEGEKLRRAPELFRALSELRQKEKQNASRRVDAEPIHALTAAEIPA